MKSISRCAPGILLFNVESASELELLAARAAHLRKAANFAMRVNPDVAANTHPYISTGLHEHKFGVPWRDAAEFIGREQGRNTCAPRGVSVHIGSQIDDVDAFGEAHAAGRRRWCGALRRRDMTSATSMPAAGWAIPYGKHCGARFRVARANAMQRDAGAAAQVELHLLLEPGRSIIGPAGVLITRVVYRKRNDGKQFVIVDAAMNDLFRPSLYNAYHEIVPVVLGVATDEIETVDVVGPVCESGDFFARGREMPQWKKANCWRFWMPEPMGCRWLRITTRGRERRKCWSTASERS